MDKEKEKILEEIERAQDRLLAVRKSMLELSILGVVKPDDFVMLNMLGDKLQKYYEANKPEYQKFSFAELWGVIEEE